MPCPGDMPIHPHPPSPGKLLCYPRGQARHLTPVTVAGTDPEPVLWASLPTSLASVWGALPLGLPSAGGKGQGTVNGVSGEGAAPFTPQ